MHKPSNVVPIRKGIDLLADKFEPVDQWLDSAPPEVVIQNVAQFYRQRPRLYALRHEYPHLVEALKRLVEFATTRFPGYYRSLSEEVVVRVFEIYYGCIDSDLEDPEVEMLREIALASDHMRRFKLLALRADRSVTAWHQQEPIPVWLKSVDAIGVSTVQMTQNATRQSASIRTHFLSKLLDTKTLSTYLVADQRLRWASL